MDSLVQSDIVCSSGTYGYGYAAAAGELLGETFQMLPGFALIAVSSGGLYDNSLRLRTTASSRAVRLASGELPKVRYPADPTGGCWNV